LAVLSVVPTTQRHGEGFQLERWDCSHYRLSIRLAVGIPNNGGWGVRPKIDMSEAIIRIRPAASQQEDSTFRGVFGANHF